MNAAPITPIGGRAARILRAGQSLLWLLIAVLPPLVINLWGQRPFTLPKVVVARTLVWLLATLALLSLLFVRRSQRRAGRLPLIGALALLGLVLIVTTATAVDWRLSLWGSYARSQGLLTQLTYLLLCLLAANTFRRFAFARQITLAMSVATLPLILLGLAQAVGWQPLGLISDARSSVFATLGRANFLGAYLAILLPLTLAQLLIAPGRQRRFIWGCLLVGQIIILRLTLTRSAWIAAAVALALFALLMWGRQLSRRRQTAAWVGISLLALSGPLTVLLWGAQVGGSVAARQAIWQQTLVLVRQRPFLGYGLETLEIVFPRVYPPQLVYAQGRSFFVDRAHNFLLDWAVAAGLPGLLAFLLVLLLFAFAISGALRRPLPRRKRLLLAGVAAAVAANLANNLLSFDTTASAIITWLLLGMGIALATPPANAVQAGWQAPAGLRWACAGLLLVGLCAGIWLVNGRPLMADVAARTAERRLQRGEWVRGVRAAETAVDAWSLEPAHLLLLNQARWREAAAAAAATPASLTAAESPLLHAQRQRPTDLAVWLHTADFYTAVTQHTDHDATAQADAAFRQAAALAPNHAIVYAAWGRAKAARGDMETAVKLLRRAVRLDASSSEAYFYLGAAELAAGRVNAAVGAYGEAVRLRPDWAPAYAGLARSYWGAGQPQEAWGAVNQALRHDPDNEEALALAAAMRQAGANLP